MKCHKCGRFMKRLKNHWHCDNCNSNTDFVENELRAICKTCNKIIYNKSSKALYCDSCALARHDVSSMKWKKRNPEKIRLANIKYKRKTRMIVCRVCKEIKKFCSHDMCIACYSKWYRLNIKLKDMNEEQKNIYLEKKGLLDEKRTLTIDDLKRDSGFEQETLIIEEQRGK